MKQPLISRLRTASPIFLILGLLFFVAALATDKNVLTIIAIVFLLASLVLGGRWLRIK
jgi:predicted membrane protein